MKKPSDFGKAGKPMSSVLKKSEAETVAHNYMVILYRKGDEWRGLSWEEYKDERIKDGHFTEGERYYFDQVAPYCQSAETARTFAPKWAAV